MSGQGKGTSANQTNRYSATFAAVLGVGPAWSVDSVAINGTIFQFEDFNVDALDAEAGGYWTLGCGDYGTAKLYLGTETQLINAALAAEETGPDRGHSAYRGWVYLVLEHFNFGSRGETNPPEIQVLWRRQPKQTIVTNDGGAASNDGNFTVNPVVVAAELLTSWDWVGLADSKLNAETFQTAADSIQAEVPTGDLDNRSFAAIAPLWTDQVDLKSALADISSVSGAWLRYGVDGRIEAGRWVRGGSTGPVTLLGPNDLTETPEIKVAESDNLPNSFTVEFTDSERYHKQGATSPVNGASVRTTGVVRNQTVQRPFLLTYDQAQRHAMDLLRENSIPAITFEGRVRRSKCVTPSIQRVYTLTFTQGSGAGGYGDISVAPLGVLTTFSEFFGPGMTASAVAATVAGRLVTEIGSNYSITVVGAVVTITTTLASQNDVLFGVNLVYPNITSVIHVVTVEGSLGALIRPGDYFQYPIQVIPTEPADIRLFRCTRRSFEPTGEITISGQLETNGAVGAVTANPVVEEVSLVVPPLYYRRVISLHPETIDDPQPIAVLAARPGNLVLGVDVLFDTSAVGTFTTIGRQDGFAVPMSLNASLSDSALNVYLKLLPITLGRNPQRDINVLGWEGGAIEATDDQLLLIVVKKDAGGALLASGSTQWVEIMSVSGHPTLSGDVYTVPVLRGRRGTSAKAFSTGTFPDSWVTYEAWLIPRSKLVAMSVFDLVGLIGNATGAFFRYVPYENGMTYDGTSAFAEKTRLGAGPYAEFINQTSATHQPQDNVILPASSLAALVAAKNAYTVVLSNEAHTVVADNAGNVDAGQLGAGSLAVTTVSVYRGDTALTAVASSPTYNQFAIGTLVSSAGTASKVSGSNISVQCDTLTADTGTVTIPVSIGGIAGFVINRLFTVSKAKVGLAGRRTATLEVFKWSTATPTSFPSGNSTYTWSSGTYTAPGTPAGWALTPGAAVAGQTLWGIAVVVTNTTTDTDTVVAWNSSSPYAAGGAGTNGTNGTSAKLLVLTSDSQTFSIPKNAGTVVPATITLTATGQNLGGTLAWSVSPSMTLTGNATDAVRTLPYASMTADAVSITITKDGQTDVISIVKVREGSDAIVAFLTNESHTVPASSVGVVSSLSGAVTDMLVYLGATNDTAAWTFSAAATNLTGTFSYSSGSIANRYSVATLTADVGYVDITATKSGQTVVKRFTLTKSLAGAAGTPGAVGPGLVYVGAYLGANTYYKTAERIDVVLYSGSYYPTANAAKNGLNTWGFPGGADWGAAFASFKAIATDLLLTVDATILKTLVMGDGSTASAGIIRSSGASAFGTGSGFWMNPRNASNLTELRIGTPNGVNLAWDGTALTLGGGSITGGTITGASLVITSPIGLRYSANNAVYTITGGSNNGVQYGAQIDFQGTDLGSVAAGGALVLQAGNGTDGEIIFRTNYGGTLGGAHFGLDRMTIARNGDIEVAQNLSALTLSSTSARRFKKKIRGMKGALATVKALRGVDFQWRDPKHGLDDFGLIAEEVRAILPSAVVYNSDGIISGIQYGKITAVLIEAVKTLSAEIDQLKRDGQRD
jgi:hypothetical protein